MERRSVRSTGGPRSCLAKFRSRDEPGQRANHGSVSGPAPVSRGEYRHHADSHRRVMNPAFNSTFVWNNLQQLSNYVSSYALVSIPDIYHVVLQGTNRQFGTISAISATGGVTTLTLPAGVTMLPGFQMTLTGLTLNTALNGKTVTLLSAAAPPAAGDLKGTVTPVTTVTFTTPAGVTITNGVETGTLYAAPSGAPGIFNFGWLEQANLIDINNPSYPLPINPVDAVHRIVPEYTSTGDQISLSCEVDYGNGVLRFRISEPVSTYPFA